MLPTPEVKRMPSSRADSGVWDLLPEERSVDALRQAAATCTACHLHERATQTVFSSGAQEARIVLVGEQPGDQEDKAGRPFVGPAGQVLSKALREAGIDRREAYVTNVVKHFKWTPGGRSGKVRIHQKPNAAEIAVCRPWLDTELEVVRPQVLVLLGATAAQALLGSWFRVTQHRGQWIDSDLAPKVLATVHPSSILRAPDEEARALAYKGLVADLLVVADALAAERPAP
jgi:uracil-DNA glycosylase family protein